MIHLIAFTGDGAALCRRLLAELEDCRCHAPRRLAGEGILPLEQPVGQWAGERFRSGDGLVFVCGAGIAVRAVAPWLKGKDKDPAVLCVEETGRYVIPLLSGHMGGANRLARRIARLTGGEAVITTATDVGGVFAFDEWAVVNGFAVMNREDIKYIAAVMLEGEAVGLSSDLPVDGPLPQYVEQRAQGERGVVISLREQAPFAKTLWLVPRCLVLGIGCRKNTAPELLERFVLELLRRHALPLEALERLVSIDLKGEEPAILRLRDKLGLPFHTYSAEELAEARGRFAASDFVRQVTGVDNVCERSAMLASDGIVVPKTTRDGMALAVGLVDRRISFGG